MRFDTDKRLGLDDIAGELETSRERVQQLSWEHGIGESIGKARIYTRADVDWLRRELNRPIGRGKKFRKCPVKGCSKKLSGREYHRHVYRCPVCGAYAHRTSTPGEANHECPVRASIAKEIEKIMNEAERRVDEMKEWRKAEFARIDAKAKEDKKRAREVANEKIEAIRAEAGRAVEEARSRATPGDPS